jgi:electron transfer flavoprotein alpha subunit
MAERILVLAEQLDGQLTDVTFELVGLARRIAVSRPSAVDALLLGDGASSLAASLPSDRVLVMDHPTLHLFNPMAAQRALEAVARETAPWLVLVPNTSLGMDVAAVVAARLGWPLVAYCRAVEERDGQLVVTSQLFGGKILADCPLGPDPTVLSVLAGAFSSEAAAPATPARIERLEPPAGLDALPVRALALERPEAADVDITRADKIVAVGRGLESKDNLELAEELAEALGAVVAASRPLVDAGWLPRSRQVGKSGLKVKPRLYLALGISGAPEHLEGMRDSELIIAVNKDPKAPIFSVAHYGVVTDLFELVEALQERLGG